MVEVPDVQVDVNIGVDAVQLSSLLVLLALGLVSDLVDAATAAVVGAPPPCELLPLPPLLGPLAAT
jgi:hypothetical protein